MTRRSPDQIIARYVWSGESLLEWQALHFEGSVLRQITPVGPGVTADVHLLSPGLTDLQVNGGGGVMFNSDPTPRGLSAMRDAHRRLGTADILPTVITDHPEITEAAAEAALSCWSESGILGLHIEGPHIAHARKGTHEEGLIRPLDLRTVTLVERLRQAGMPVMITLAPELAEPALLRRLVASGAVVSAGHSGATELEARQAFAQGVRCVTHLFNAMDQMSSRAPGLLGAAILSPVACGLICDGIHVSWDMLRIALAARPKGALSFAVSDAMATVGGPESFTLYDQQIAVHDGRLINREGALAGAHIDQLGNLRNLVHHVGLPLPAALAMVTSTPRAILGLPARRISPGLKSTDLLYLDKGLMPLQPVHSAH